MTDKRENNYAHARKVFVNVRNQLGFHEMANRAALAKLRRVGPRDDDPSRLDLTRLLGEKIVTQLIIKHLGLDAGQDWTIECAVAALSVLADIRTPSPTHPAAALQGVMKPDRFNRLLAADTPMERLLAGRRVARMLKGRASVGDLGASIYLWTQPVKTRWAFAYYQASLPENHDDSRTEMESV